MDAGTGGIAIDTADGGAISIDAIGASSNFSLASTSNGDDLTIAVTGTYDSSLVLSSTGTGVDAIKVNATNSAGGIDIDAGTNGIDIDSTGTINIATSKNGASALVLTSSAGGVDITATGAEAGEDINITATGSSINLTSTEAQANAIKIYASNAAGGIDMDAGSNGVKIDAGGDSNFTTAAGTLTLTAADSLDLSSTTGDINFQDGGTNQLSLDLDTNTTEVVMQLKVNGDDFVFKNFDGTEVFRVEDNGDFDIAGGSGSSGVTVTSAGAITASGDITALSSDKRLKENIEVIESPLEKLNQLSGFTYDWDKGSCEKAGFEPNDEKQVGVFAQDVQKVIPEAVKLAPFDRDESGESKSGDNYLTVQYEKLVPLLIESNKALLKRIEELEELVKNKIG